MMNCNLFPSLHSNKMTGDPRWSPVIYVMLLWVSFPPYFSNYGEYEEHTQVCCNYRCPYGGGDKKGYGHPQCCAYDGYDPGAYDNAFKGARYTIQLTI